MNTCKDFGAIIKALGGATRLGPALDIENHIVSNWIARGSIPSPYWVDLMEAIKRHNAYVRTGKVRGVTYTLLAHLADRNNSG